VSVSRREGDGSLLDPANGDILLHGCRMESGHVRGDGIQDRPCSERLSAATMAATGGDPVTSALGALPGPTAMNRGEQGKQLDRPGRPVTYPVWPSLAARWTRDGDCLLANRAEAA
jgi:hypothetical protein